MNEVWCGDSSVGPYLRTADGRKRRVYVIALIDDASRLVTGAGVFFEDTFVNLMSVMKSAVAKYGVPRMFNFDNGSAYKNKQMELLAARIGTTINYCKPYTPTAKAKVERWFRTMKDQWMASLDMRDFPSLEALSGSLCAYVRGYNLSAHSSLKGSTPQERFFSEPEKVRRLPEEKMKTDFLLELERRVSADSVVTIGNVEYEVDMRFARQRIGRPSGICGRPWLSRPTSTICSALRTGAITRNRRDSGGDAANLFGTFCPKEPGLGRLPNKHIILHFGVEYESGIDFYILAVFIFMLHECKLK